jgi:outer membrane receptor protein involved in Fe transport
VNFDANYTIKKKWRIGLSYNFLGGRYALIDGQAVKMKNVHDLNIYFSYQVLDFLEIFANGKNLANVKADTYYGYTSMGINGMIGATFRF